MDLATLYVTTSSSDEARRLATGLLEQRLVACANIIEGVTSLYRWKGAIEQDKETVMLLKTRAELVQQATTWIASNHSYETPCVVAWPIIGGNEDYLRWVAEEATGRASP